MPYRSEVKHENTLHEVVVPDLPAFRCNKCHAVVVSDDADLKVRATLRSQLGLLQPETIKAKRIALGLSQEALAAKLGFAGESVSRWERGVIQSRATDTTLRAFFKLPELFSFEPLIPVGTAEWMYGGTPNVHEAIKDNTPGLFDKICAAIAPIFVGTPAPVPPLCEKARAPPPSLLLQSLVF